MQNIHKFKNIENSNNYYLIEFSDALVAVDPPRDAWQIIDFANKINKPITYILETHIHNDYLTGAFEIKEVFSSAHVVPKEDVTFDHIVASESFQIMSDHYKITAFNTPGHTYSHVSYKLFENTILIAVFSGGSVTSSGVGRTDLISEEDTPVLTNLQFDSKNLFLDFEDNVYILPTHGQGSFCGVSKRTLPDYPKMETLKVDNDLLRIDSVEGFSKSLLSSLGAYPTYFGNTKLFNKGEANLIKEITPPFVTNDVEVIAETIVIDTSADKDFRVENALKIPMSKTFSSYVGWTIKQDRLITLVFEDSYFADFDIKNITFQNDMDSFLNDEISKTILSLYRIGIENIKYLIPLSILKKIAVHTVTKESFNSEVYYDLRELNEKSSNGEFTFDRLARFYYENESLPKEFSELKTTNLSCGSGYRASIIASILGDKKIKILKDTSIDFAK
tara:strand:+ start:188 stop:1531 length:1344 start_codon:yes stop_codon:yes gene_type:complete